MHLREPPNEIDALAGTPKRNRCTSRKLQPKSMQRLGTAALTLRHCGGPPLNQKIVFFFLSWNHSFALNWGLTIKNEINAANGVWCIDNLWIWGVRFYFHLRVQHRNKTPASIDMGFQCSAWGLVHWLLCCTPIIKSMHMIGYRTLICDSFIHCSTFFLGHRLWEPTMAETNSFLVSAKALCFDTPEKTEKCKSEPVKKEDGTPEKPGPMPATKKLCSTTEKLLKKLPGDTSYLRETWVSSARHCI